MTENHIITSWKAIFFFFFCLLLLIFSSARADLKCRNFTADARPMILLEKFGFSHAGHVNIAVSSVSIASLVSQQLDLSHFGFFLVSSDSWLNRVIIQIQQNSNYDCVLESMYINLLFTFRDLSTPPDSSFNQSYPVLVVPNEYNLFFANCAGLENKVTMEVCWSHAANQHAM